MISRLFFCESLETDPYRNLAIEETLLHHVSDCAILYLWQNENTVVIGKNQNPWKECKTTLLQQEGGSLARRMSGGGAVYHDLGNLNFTILLPQADFSLDRQSEVILKAVSGLGIPAERSGRNDILVGGYKFSGNAFYKNGSRAYHHGTLLIDADLEKLGRYLSPSKRKLEAKGVDSVRSRVANLSQWRQDLTVSQVKQALSSSFSDVYGLPQERMEIPRDSQVDALTRRNSGWDWNFGKKQAFSCVLEERFSWGGVEVQLELSCGKITGARVYTDAMDPDWAPLWEKALLGCPLEATSLRRTVPLTAPSADLETLFAQL